MAYPTGADRARQRSRPSNPAAPEPKDDRYRDGIVIWETPEDAKVPFLLKFNVNTQLRYLNTLDSQTRLSPTTWALSAMFICATISR